MRFLIRSTIYAIYGATTGAMVGVYVAYVTDRRK